MKKIIFVTIFIIISITIFSEKFENSRSILITEGNDNQVLKNNSDHLTSKEYFSFSKASSSTVSSAAIKDDTSEVNSSVATENIRKLSPEKKAGFSDNYQQKLDKTVNQNDTSVSHKSSASNDTSEQNNNESSSSKDGARFVKVDASGDALPTTAKNWVCVFDRNTKLLWEVNGLNQTGFSNAFKYQWADDLNETFGTTYDPESKIKECSYFSGSPDSNNHKCTTAIYQLATNYMSLCGKQNWSLPNIIEMHSIVTAGQFNPAVDLQYFPFTLSTYYWSSQGFAYTEDRAWAMNFAIGKENDVEKSEFHNIMLISRDANY